MTPSERIKEYVGLICEQVRWKKAHSSIAEELENHIVDQMSAYMVEGIDEETATDKAIAMTGEPVVIGNQLDRVYRPKPQWGMLALTGALILCGVLIQALIFDGDDMPRLLSSRLVGIGIGMLVMVAAYLTDFTLIGKSPKLFYAVIVSIFCGVIVSWWRPNSYSRWLWIGGGITINPIYLALLCPLAFAALIYAYKNKGYRGFVFCEMGFFMQVFVLLYVPQLSWMVLFVICGVVLMCVALQKNWFGSIKKIYCCLMMFTPLVFMACVYLEKAWIRSRLAVAYDPSLDPYGGGYMATMVRGFLKNAKLLGHAEMPAKYDIFGTYLSSMDTDFILTNLIVEAGWIAFIIVSGLMLFFIIKALLLCLRQKSALGMFVSLAVVLTFLEQTVGYIAYNLGFQLFSPLSLPLISYGNNAMVINMGLIGIMLSVFRTGDVIKDKNTQRSLFMQQSCDKLR